MSVAAEGATRSLIPARIDRLPWSPFTPEWSPRSGSPGSSTATTVRVDGGKGGDVVTTDGPYTETKEVLTGFYLLECADLDEAVGLAAKIPAAWTGGIIEVRPVIPMG